MSVMKSINHILIINIFLFIFSFYSNSAPAMEFECIGPADKNIHEYIHDENFIVRAKGEIVDGDFAKFQSAMEDIKSGSQCGVDPLSTSSGYYGHYILQLESPGGNYVEALQIANLVVDRYVATYVAPNSECLSACALIFMSGMRHIGDGERLRSRTMHHTAKIGFHSPFLEAVTTQGLPPELMATLMSDAYENAISAAAQLTVLAIKARWEQGFVNIVLRVPATEFVYIDTVGKASDWGVSVTGLEIRISDLESDLENACINYNYWKSDSAGLNAALTEKFDPSTTLAPTRDDFQNAKNEDIFKSRDVGSSKFVELSFGTEWDGEWCRFIFFTEDTFELAEPIGNISEFETIHIIPSYVNLNSLSDYESEKKNNVKPFLEATQIIKTWDHNGSTMSLDISDDNNVIIAYQVPRDGLEKIGIAEGTILFEGVINGKNIVGKSRLFSSKGCPTLIYDVIGELPLRENKEFILRGQVPIRGKGCSIVGYKSTGSNANLIFSQIN